MRNVLEELKKSHRRKQNPTILGIREHIFTGRSALPFNGCASHVGVQKELCSRNVLILIL
jgi:hypothetical protein